MSQSPKSKKYAIIAAIILTIAASVTSVYFVSAQTVLTVIPETEDDKKRNNALGVAQRFVVTSPTFAFDGNINSLDTESIGSIESFPSQYLITMAFDSANSGFGNRNGQTLDHVTTPHKIDIIVSDGVVISAITDQIWDELNHQYVLKKPQQKLQSSNDLPPTFDVEVTDYLSFVNAIKSRGLFVTELETIDDSFFSVPIKVISVSGLDLQVYEFKSDSDAEIAKKIVSLDGTEIGLSIIRWMDVPHFYGQNKIIVQYIGHNPEMLNLLDSLLGSQFAGM